MHFIFVGLCIPSFCATDQMSSALTRLSWPPPPLTHSTPPLLSFPCPPTGESCCWLTRGSDQEGGEGCPGSSGQGTGESRCIHSCKSSPSISLSISISLSPLLHPSHSCLSFRLLFTLRWTCHECVNAILCCFTSWSDSTNHSVSLYSRNAFLLLCIRSHDQAKKQSQQQVGVRKDLVKAEKENLKKVCKLYSAPHHDVLNILLNKLISTMMPLIHLKYQWFELWLPLLVLALHGCPHFDGNITEC